MGTMESNMKQPTDNKPNGEGVRSSVKTLTMDEWFAMLPIVSGTQTRACMRCGTPMWSEGVKGYHFRGDCVAADGEPHEIDDTCPTGTCTAKDNIAVLSWLNLLPYSPGAVIGRSCDKCGTRL